MHPYSLHTRLSTMLRECVSTPDGAEVIGRLLRTLARWMPMPVIGSNGTTVDRRPAPLPPYVRDHHAEAADAYDRAAERGLCIALRQHAHGRRLSERRPESELMSLQD